MVHQKVDWLHVIDQVQREHELHNGTMTVKDASGSYNTQCHASYKILYGYVVQCYGYNFIIMHDTTGEIKCGSIMKLWITTKIACILELCLY